jgi:3-hydroxybutyryl-CoA dehydratase
LKIGQTVKAIVEISDLNPPRKSATLRTRCIVKESVVIDGEVIVLAPTRD